MLFLLLNWPVLQAFLSPLCPSTHIGISAYGLLNGRRLDHRLVDCWCGFFVQIRFEASPIFLSELLDAAPAHARHCTSPLERPLDMVFDLWLFTYLEVTHSLPVDALTRLIWAHIMLLMLACAVDSLT